MCRKVALSLMFSPDRKILHRFLQKFWAFGRFLQEVGRRRLTSHGGVAIMGTIEGERRDCPKTLYNVRRCPRAHPAAVPHGADVVLSGHFI